MGGAGQARQAKLLLLFHTREAYWNSNLTLCKVASWRSGTASYCARAWLYLASFTTDLTFFCRGPEDFKWIGQQHKQFQQSVDVGQLHWQGQLEGKEKVSRNCR